MIETSALYKTLFNAGAMQEYKIEVAGIVYDQNVIYDKTEISENLFDTDTFTIGSFTVSSLRVKLWLESHEIPRNAGVKFYYRYVNDVEQSEWILKFAGNVVDRTRYTDEITTIEAYSKAANYDVFLNHFGSAISSYPANARTVANLCATHLGLTIENIEDVYNGNIVEYPNELTMVQVLQNIAKSSGGNWAIVGEDKLRLVVLDNTTPTLEYHAQTISQSELLSPISMVRAYWKDDSAFEAGNDSGSVLEIDNPWATQENTDYLLGTLGGYEYVPVNGKGVYADPALQLGDTFKYSNGVQQTVAKVKWTFDGITTADIETPQENEVSYDNPYDILAQQEFKKKVTLGESYQGVSIGRETGIQMLLSPDGTEENATGRYYADLNKGMAMQWRDTPADDWHDWMYFDKNEKTFKLSLYSTTTEVDDKVADAINTIELTPGPPTYTWIRYADDVNGSGISNSPTGKAYIGFAYNKLTATESNTPGDYSWALIKGDKGDTGVKGETGADGQTFYTWIKYSDNADGTDLYDVPKASTLYIGIATNKTSATESTIKTDYIWSKFKGDKGDTGYTPIKGVDYFDGVDGQDGKGIVSAVVRYQNHTNGTAAPTGTWTTNPSPIKGQYLWTRTVTTYTEGDPVTTYSVAYQAIDGTSGTDGRGIVSTVVDYVKSTTVTMPSTGWSTTRPTVNKGEYLWTRTTINYTSGSPSVSISNSYVPTDGQNGSSAYLWVRYSQNANGNPMTTSPVDAKYIGVATTNTSTEPDDYNLYSWSLIKGQDGVKGETGQDGQTSYLHIKYSNDGGLTFTGNGGEDVGDWIGTYVDFVEADSNSVSSYTWNKVKGEQGPQGATGEQGPKGDTGTSVSSVVEWYLATNLSSGVTTGTSGWTTTMQPMTTTKKYLWNYEEINFSDGSSSPTIPVIIGVYGNTGATGRALTGVTEYYLASASASGVTRPATDGTNGWTTTMQTTSVDKPYLWNYEKLTWSVAPTTSYIEPIIIGVHGATGPQGDEGPQGVQGPKGDNGISQYVHIRYSANSNGNPMTPSPQATTKYIGLANTTSATAPTGYSSYTWSLIKGQDGAQGPQGVQGPAGANGQPTYTWVKYADTPTSGMDDYPEGKKYIGLAFNKTTPTESTSYSQYQWSLMPQNIEIGGRNYFARVSINNIGDISDVLTSGSDLKGYSIRVVEGEQYTIHRTNTTNNRWRFYWVYTDEVEGSTTHTTAFSDDSQESHVPNTVKAPSGAKWGHLYLSDNDSDGITIPNIMIEKGNMATDWTPAPEDTDERFNEQDTTLSELRTISQNNTSQINLTNESITSLVSQEAHQASLNSLQENLEGYVSGEVATRITDYSSEVNQQFDNVTTRFTGVTTSIDSLGNKLQNELDKIETYIRFDINGIELGKIGESDDPLYNPIKLFISNDRISFKQNDVEVAYIDNNRLYITDGEFLNSLSLGNFAFTPRSNGNLSFGKVK